MAKLQPGDLFEVARGPRARAHICKSDCAGAGRYCVESWCGRAYLRNHCRPVIRDWLTWTECEVCVRAERRAKGGTP